MHPGLTSLESDALRRCLAQAATQQERERLEGQIAIATLSRTPVGEHGYELAFDVPSQRRDQSDESFLLECEGRHSEGHVVSFTLWVFSDVVEFLALSCTGQWPEDDAAISFD